LILSTSLVVVEINGDCKMYGVCGNRGIHDLNCVYDGPGMTLNDTEAENILLRRCPDIFKDCKITNLIQKLIKKTLKHLKI
jgi:hypothetical protein